MYWNEKLDIIKKKYPQTEFKDIFREGREVAEKIIRTFHNASYMTFTRSKDRKILLKSPILVKDTNILGAESYLEELADGINYWLFMVDVPMGLGFQVYDCRKQALLDLYYLSMQVREQEFYVVDKKYKWLLYFHINRDTNSAYIYKNEKEL